MVPKRKEVHLVWSVGAKVNSGEQVGPNLHNALNWAHKKFYPKGERTEPKNNRRV